MTLDTPTQKSQWIHTIANTYALASIDVDFCEFATFHDNIGSFDQCVADIEQYSNPYAFMKCMGDFLKTVPCRAHAFRWLINPHSDVKKRKQRHGVQVSVAIPELQHLCRKNCHLASCILHLCTHNAGFIFKCSCRKCKQNYFTLTHTITSTYVRLPDILKTSMCLHTHTVEQIVLKVSQPASKEHHYMHTAYPFSCAVCCDNCEVFGFWYKIVVCLFAAVPSSIYVLQYTK